MLRSTCEHLTKEMTQRATVIIEKDESHLLLSPIGLITNCAFNCDGQPDIQTQNSFRCTISCLALRCSAIIITYVHQYTTVDLMKTAISSQNVSIF